MSDFKTVGLVSRVNNDQISESLSAVVTLLEFKGISVVQDLPWEQLGERCDLLIAVGGDGNILSAARAMAPFGVPILGINRGKLGFLADISPDQIDTQLAAVLDGDYTIEEHFLLEGLVDGHDGVPSALNEVVIHSANMPKMLDIELYVDGRYVNTQPSDGLIISSPTGSTAYALSAGGPVISPDCPVLQLTPIAPHSLASRALVFSDKEPVTVFPATPERLMMVVDGSAGCYVWPEDRVLIRRSEHPVRFVRLVDHEFFQVLRNKLGWGLPHIAKPDKG